MADKFSHPDKQQHFSSKKLHELVPRLEGEMTRQDREDLRNALLKLEGHTNLYYGGGGQGGGSTTIGTQLIGIIRYSSGRPYFYTYDEIGLTRANSELASGDVIFIPSGTITLTKGYTIPASTSWSGMGVGITNLQSSGDIGTQLLSLSGSSRLEEISVKYTTANSASARYAVHLTAANASVRRVSGQCTNAGSGAGTGIQMATASGSCYATSCGGIGSSGSGSGIGINAQDGADLRLCQGVSISTGGNSAGIIASGAILQQCQAIGGYFGTGGKYGLYIYSETGSQTTQVYDGMAQAATYDLYIADGNTTATFYGLHYDTYFNNGGILTFGYGDREAANHRHEASTTQPGGTLNLIDSPITIVDNALNNSFPSIAQTSDGNLLVVYRAGVGHSGDLGSIKAKISADNGATWGAEINVYTDGTYDSRDPNLIVLPSGRVLVNFFLATVAPAKIADAVRVRYSDDNGATWSALASLNSSFTAESASSGPIIRYPFGRLALPIYGKNTGDTYDTSAVMFSDDSGATWSGEVIIADGERDSRHYSEPNLIYADFFGNTICVMRSDTPSAAAGSFYSSYSTDDGKLWSVPSSEFSATGAPRMFQLKNHMVLIIYRNNDDVTEALYRISRDNGYSWSSSSVLDDTSVVQMTYGSACEYDEGVLGIAVGTENVYAGDSNILFYRMYTTVEAGQLQSNVATGVAPITTNSTTLVSNLNADLLDGLDTSNNPGASAAVLVTDANGDVTIEGVTVNGDLKTGDTRTINVTEIDHTVSPFTADDDEVIICDTTTAVITVNLPAISGITGRKYYIKNIGTNILTVDGNGAETIDGATTATLSTQYDSITLVATSTEWSII